MNGSGNGNGKLHGAVVAVAAWSAGFGPPWPLLAGAIAGAALGAWLEMRRA